MRSRSIVAVQLIIILGAVETLTAAARAQGVTGVTPSDWPAGMTAPIAVPLPPGDWSSDGITAILRVGNAKDAQRVVANYEAADTQAGTPARAWIMWAAGPVDRNKPLNITFEKAAQAKPAYVTKFVDPLVTVSADDQPPILTYYQGRAQAGMRHPLTDYIHPLLGLDGEMLSALRPQDHEQHRGVFWAWVRHDENGKPIGDWWQPKDIRLEPGPFRSDDGPIMSRFSAIHTWIYEPKDAKSESFMNESVVCRVFSTTHQGRALDVEITLIPLIDHLKIGGTLDLEKGYGGFTFRYSQMRDPAIVADGKRVTRDINQLRVAWADFSALFMRRPGEPNKERTGAAIFVDPHHPDFPPEWITRLYGLLNVSYPGLRTLDLTTGRPLRLQYRIWIHRGDAAEGAVEAAFKAYAADWRWQGAAATQPAPAR